MKREGSADPHQVLGVPADASRADIVRAYRRLARRAHPDTRAAGVADDAWFHEVTRAYERLTGPLGRAQPSPAPATPAPRPARARPARPNAPGGSPLIWAGPVHVEPPAGAG